MTLDAKKLIKSLKLLNLSDNTSDDGKTSDEDNASDESTESENNTPAGNNNSCGRNYLNKIIIFITLCLLIWVIIKNLKEH